jgi:serpin B
MYLINAVYFNAGWSYPFDTGATNPWPFVRADGSTVFPEMMYAITDLIEEANDLDVSPFGTYSGSDYQSVTLPYGSEEYRMTLILPDTSTTCEELVADFTVEEWESLRASQTYEYVELRLPRFRFSYETSLKSTLKALGMEIAFSNFADFTNITTQFPITISDVLHKSFVQVDEEGTEAAAVTVVIFIGVGMIDEALVFNRPFMFVVHEESSGAILFMGKVADPVWSE